MIFPFRTFCDPLADIYHYPLTAAFVGHDFTALGSYREPDDQDRFTQEEVARFFAMLVLANSA